MAKITVDGVEYETETLNDNGKAQLASMQFIEAHMIRLRNEIAVFETAKRPGRGHPQLRALGLERSGELASGDPLGFGFAATTREFFQQAFERLLTDLVERVDCGPADLRIVVSRRRPQEPVDSRLIVNVTELTEEFDGSLPDCGTLAAQSVSEPFDVPVSCVLVQRHQPLRYTRLRLSMASYLSVRSGGMLSVIPRTSTPSSASDASSVSNIEPLWSASI